MNWEALLAALFGKSHDVKCDGDLLSGTAQFNEHTLTVVGTTHHAAIGVELALAQARVVLNTVREHPGRGILLLVDTQGQRLRHRDELLGINRYMAHMGCCVELARRQHHPVIGLVYDQALSGGFITSGLMADACYALPEAEIRVMRLPAIAQFRLRTRSATSPAPSVLSPKMPSASNASVLTAPACSARGLRRFASANACSLNGTVTLAPRPPAAMNCATLSAKPSFGARIASYVMS